MHHCGMEASTVSCQVSWIVQAIAGCAENVEKFIETSAHDGKREHRSTHVPKRRCDVRINQKSEQTGTNEF